MGVEFARPIGRALIEARSWLDPRLAARWFARPIGRALIEATVGAGTVETISGRLHGQLAVPSLKREHLLLDRADAHVCTANWPCPH